MKPLPRLSAALRDALFPNKCSACGRFFHPPPLPATQPSHALPVSVELFEKLMPAFLCRSCIRQFYPITSPKCKICGEMFPSRAGGGDHTCGACLKQKPHFNRVRSAGEYDGAFRTLIHALKYKGKIQLARPLSRLLFHAFISYRELEAAELIVPTPLHPSRERQRGFNQAALLLRQWPPLFRQYGGAAPDIAHDRHILKRVRKTPAQTGLNQRQRMTNIRQAFALQRPAAVEGKNILLIDDVCTTGATVDECARVLKKGGANSVNVLTLARASEKLKR